MDTTPRWTDDALTLAWQTGRDYQQARLDEAADDITHAPARIPALTYEQRVAMRHDEMLRSVAPDEYLGGPVPWDNGRALPPALAAAGHRDRTHDQATIAAATHNPPAYTDWPTLHAASTPAVWWRIWWDLTDTTRARLEHLAPATAVRLGGDLQ